MQLDFFWCINILLLLQQGGKETSVQITLLCVCSSKHVRHSEEGSLVLGAAESNCSENSWNFVRYVYFSLNEGKAEFSFCNKRMQLLSHQVRGLESQRFHL